jgi:hypothetical protein
VRFVALGDGGEGNDQQYAVAAAMDTVCAAKTDGFGDGCEFALYLGDNFYDNGVDSVDDIQFQTKFELPYAELDFPFYIVLGNHDYGALSIDIFRINYQVEYADTSEKWTMPGTYYSFEQGPALFLGLDTNAIMIEDVPLMPTSEQYGWIGPTIDASVKPWRIAFGHHPYISNGPHGNAGTYEGLPGIPVVSGGSVKDFFDDHICGMADVYFSGHDHDRQWLEPTCGTQFIVTGAAAKTSDLVGRGTPTKWEDDASPGFMWVELRDDVMTGEFYNQDGVLEYTHSFTRSR